MALDYHLLGTRIAERRKAIGISQLEFAEKIDKSTAFVSRLERGKKGPSLETLIQIADVLNTTPDELLKDNLPKTEEGNDYFSSTPYELYILRHTMQALQQILRDGEHLRNQDK